MVRIFTVTGQYIYTSQCTYLNISLLVTPYEYVLHGIALGIY
jgi:hypothetical protein